MFLSRCDNYKYMCIYVACIISKCACLFSLQCISASLAFADFFHWSNLGLFASTWCIFPHWHTCASHLGLFTDAITWDSQQGVAACNVCVCVCGAESKAAVAGISDILSFKDSLCTTRDDGENSCMLHWRTLKWRCMSFLCKGDYTFPYFCCFLIVNVSCFYLIANLVRYVCRMVKKEYVFSEYRLPSVLEGLVHEAPQSTELKCTIY